MPAVRVLEASPLGTALGAGQAQGRSRIEFKTPHDDFLAATDAIAIFVRVDALQCRSNTDAHPFTALLGCQRHGLLLHRVHARESADFGLVEFNRAAVFAAQAAEIVQFGAAGEKFLLHGLQIAGHGDILGPDAREGQRASDHSGARRRLSGAIGAQDVNT